MKWYLSPSTDFITYILTYLLCKGEPLRSSRQWSHCLTDRSIAQDCCRRALNIVVPIGVTRSSNEVWIMISYSSYKSSAVMDERLNSDCEIWRQQTRNVELYRKVWEILQILKYILNRIHAHHECNRQTDKRTDGQTFDSKYHTHLLCSAKNRLYKLSRHVTQGVVNKIRNHNTEIAELRQPRIYSQTNSFICCNKLTSTKVYVQDLKHPQITQQVAQLSQTDLAAGWVSYGKKWKTGNGRQYLRTL